MSVAAMTMDDQRPLMNSYDKMSKQYEQNLHGGVGGGSGAPPSGPASPTPSGSEEPSASQHQQYHHSHHHHMSHMSHASHMSHSTSHHHHQHHPSQYHHHRHQHATVAIADQQSPPSPTPTSSHQQQHQHEQQQSLSTANTAAAVAVVEQRQRLLEEEIENLKLEQTRLSQQCADAQRREKILMRRLANKEQEFQDYVSQIAEYKAAQAPSALALRSALLDPAVNLLFDKLKKELKATKAKLEETQNELSAWKFTPDSNTGKRLMAKCRLLYQENEELGKMTSNGRLAKLQTELAMQKSFREEVKKSQSELDDFLQELDEDVEGMQSTILFLQQELKTTRDRIQMLEKENYQLKNGSVQEAVKVEMEEVQVSLNGNACTDVKAMSVSYNSLQQSTATTVTNEMQYQASSTLATIDENACLHTVQQQVQADAIVAADFYNGAEPNAPVAALGGDDGSNGSSNNSGNAKFRTAASRKRNYDSDSNETATITASTITAVAAAPQVAAPRTLPPKKSKLRLTPVRRVSAQSTELNEQDAVGGNGGLTGGLVAGGTVSVCGIGSETLGMGIVVDNAVAGMANEELLTSNTAGGALVDDVADSSAGGVAQRIMTRRRSVRTQQQQNGSGADSNH